MYLPHRLIAIIPEIMYVEGRLLARAVMLLSLLVTGDEMSTWDTGCGDEALGDVLYCSGPHVPFQLGGNF